jgi:hypothetical protein
MRDHGGGAGGQGRECLPELLSRLECRSADSPRSFSRLCRSMPYTPGRAAGSFVSPLSVPHITPRTQPSYFDFVFVQLPACYIVGVCKDSFPAQHRSLITISKDTATLGSYQLTRRCSLSAGVAPPDTTTSNQEPSARHEDDGEYTEEPE